MKLSFSFSVLCLFAWTAVAVDPKLLQIKPRDIIASRTLQIRAPSSTQHTATASKTKAPNSPTGTKHPKAKKTGLTKAAKIGIAVGVPLGVLVIAASIGAYIIGKRRGRKRRVDDPTAGAGKMIQDPSPELNILPPTPLRLPVAELPAAGSGGSTPITRNREGWWKSPFRGSASMKNSRYKALPKPVDSPQELPA